MSAHRLLPPPPLRAHSSAADRRAGLRLPRPSPFFLSSLFAGHLWLVPGSYRLGEGSWCPGGLVSEGGGDVCFLSLCQKLLGATGVFAVPCECHVLTLCIVCQRLEGCHASGVVCVRRRCVLCARIVAVMCVMSVVWGPVDAMEVECYDLCDMRFVNPQPSSRHL